MKIKKIENDGAQKLILCFAGWSATPEALAHLEAEPDTDVWICYDYRSLTFAEDLTPYRQIDLVAWSLGVWVAARTLAATTLHSATAICGTGCPVDDMLGIPSAIFKGTLENITDEGMERFNRRMCGSKENLSAYRLFPSRSANELKDELLNLYNHIHNEGAAEIRWTATLIGTGDMIFPTANQRNYWQGRSLVDEINTSHYPFNLWKQWKEIINR